MTKDGYATSKEQYGAQKKQEMDDLLNSKEFDSMSAWKKTSEILSRTSPTGGGEAIAALAIFTYYAGKSGIEGITGGVKQLTSFVISKFSKEDLEDLPMSEIDKACEEAIKASHNQSNEEEKDNKHGNGQKPV